MSRCSSGQDMSIVMSFSFGCLQGQVLTILPVFLRMDMRYHETYENGGGGDQLAAIRTWLTSCLLLLDEATSPVLQAVLLLTYSGRRCTCCRSFEKTFGPPHVRAPQHTAHDLGQAEGSE